MHELVICKIREKEKRKRKMERVVLLPVIVGYFKSRVRKCIGTSPSVIFWS